MKGGKGGDSRREKKGEERKRGEWMGNEGRNGEG